MIDGLDKLTQMIQNLQEQEKYLDSLNGKAVDPKRISMFQSGQFLHQNSDQASEQESIKFELEQKAAFDLLQDMKNNLYQIMQK